MASDADLTSPRYVADRLAIRDTVTRYFTAIDHRDFELLRRCFTDDVVAVYEDVQVAGGVDRIIDFCSGKSEFRFPLEIVDIERSMHFMGNHAAEVTDDTATSETYALAHLVDRPPSGRRMRTRGLRYVDELARQPDGSWLISRREHILEWMRADDLLG
jgi:ketosteroid isomerase-like protein